MVAGRGSNVAFAGLKSRSWVQCRGRGSKVADGENDLREILVRVRGILVKMTDNVKEKNRFYARYSSVANLQFTNARINIILSKEET